MTERTTENTTLNTNERESNQAQGRRVAAVAAPGSRRWLMLGLPLAGLLAVTAGEDGTAVTVTTRASERTLFLSLIGVDSVSATGTARSNAVGPAQTR